MTGLPMKMGNLETGSPTGRIPREHETGIYKPKTEALGRNQPCLGLLASRTGRK